ncbi:hypothetical protein ACLOJK_040709 [Asimina triloba]
MAENGPLDVCHARGAERLGLGPCFPRAKSATRSKEELCRRCQRIRKVKEVRGEIAATIIDGGKVSGDAFIFRWSSSLPFPSLPQSTPSSLPQSTPSSLLFPSLHPTSLLCPLPSSALLYIHLHRRFHLSCRQSTFSLPVTRSGLFMATSQVVDFRSSLFTTSSFTERQILFKAPMQEIIYKSTATTFDLFTTSSPPYPVYESADPLKSVGARDPLRILSQFVSFLPTHCPANKLPAGATP